MLTANRILLRLIRETDNPVKILKCAPHMTTQQARTDVYKNLHRSKENCRGANFDFNLYELR